MLLINILLCHGPKYSTERSADTRFFFAFITLFFALDKVFLYQRQSVRPAQFQTVKVLNSARRYWDRSKISF